MIDASQKQLAQDSSVAKRDNLTIETIQCDIANLSAFEDETFDLIFNLPSMMFIPDPEPVWHECYRVLRDGGILMTGFLNPDGFIFDEATLDKKRSFVVDRPLPYVQHETLSQEELKQHIRERQMFHFSHTMEALLGGAN